MKRNWTTKTPLQPLAFYWFLVDIVNNENLHKSFLEPELMQVDITGKYVSSAGKRVSEMILISDLPNAFWSKVEKPPVDLEQLRAIQTEKTETEKTANQKIRDWSEERTGAEFCLFTVELKRRFADEDILNFLELLDEICRHCWNSTGNCQCWNDE